MGQHSELVGCLLTAALTIALTLVCIRVYTQDPGTAKPEVRLVRAAVVVAAALACLLVVSNCVRGVNSNWSANRLTPAAAFTHGINPYTTYEQGPQISWMYGPGAVLGYTPAAVFPTPVASLVAAHLWTALLVWSPLLAMCLAACGSTPGWGRTPGLYAFMLALLLAPSWRLSPLYEVTGRVIADAPALACSGWALFVLVFGPTRRRRLRLVCTALLATFAVWTKQTLAPILLILPLAAWVIEGPGAALCLLVYAGLMNAVALAGFSVLFGLDRLFFTMVTHPLNWGWQADVSFGQLSYVPLQGGLWPKLRVLAEVGHECTLLAMPAVVALLLLSLQALSGEGDCGRSWGSPRARRATAVAAALAVGLLPLGMLARAKTGGFMNVHSAWLYFLVVCLCTLGAAHPAWRRAREGPPALARRIIYLLSLVLGAVLCIALHDQALTVLPVFVLAAGVLASPRLRIPQWLGNRLTAAALLFLALLPLLWAHVGGTLVSDLKALGQTPLAQASAYVRRAPGEAWFPGCPLVHVLHEGQLHHARAGIWDRVHARHPVPLALFRQHVPHDVRIVAFERLLGKQDVESIEQGLAGLSLDGVWHRADVPNLPAFTCFTREQPPAAENVAH